MQAEKTFAFVLAGMTLSFRAGHVVDAGPTDTIADGVAGRYVLPEVLDDLRDVATDAFLVSEESIRDGMRLLYRCSGLIVEPAAALGIAVILENRDRFRGMTVATILCGGNISTTDFEAWVVRRNLSRPIVAADHLLTPIDF
jgi:threonine dehydratase